MRLIDGRGDSEVDNSKLNANGRENDGVAYHLHRYMVCTLLQSILVVVSALGRRCFKYRDHVPRLHPSTVALAWLRNESEFWRLAAH